MSATYYYLYLQRPGTSPDNLEWDLFCYHEIGNPSKSIDSMKMFAEFHHKQTGLRLKILDQSGTIHFETLNPPN